MSDLFEDPFVVCSWIESHGRAINGRLAVVARSLREWVSVPLQTESGPPSRDEFWLNVLAHRRGLDRRD